MDIFFFEAFEEEEEALRRYLPAHIQADFSWKTIQEYGATSPPAPVISVRTQSALDPAWSHSLQVIISRSTGYDHLERFLETAPVAIPCGYLPLYCNRAVAEQAMLLWTALLRKLPMQLQHFERFHRDGLTGREVMGKKLLVVGVGYIGYEIVKIGHGLEMEVRCVDLEKKYPEEDYVGIEEGLAWADIAVCAMNLTPDNTAYFSYGLLKKSKPGLLFINISRGELSPAVDLLRLLEEGHLGGLALDVYKEEKALSRVLRGGAKEDHPEVAAVMRLSQHPLAICTPHNAFNTEEGVERKAEQSVQQLLAWMDTGKLIWQV